MNEEGGQLLALEADEDSEMSWDSESPGESREVAEHWKERRDEDAKDNTNEPNDRKILGAQFTKEDFEARRAWIQRAYTKSISIMMEDQKDDEDRSVWGISQLVSHQLTLFCRLNN